MIRHILWYFDVIPPTVTCPRSRLKQMPSHHSAGTPYAPSPAPYVYVSSSDSSPDSPRAAQPTRGERVAPVHFPSADQVDWAEPTVQNTAAGLPRVGSLLTPEDAATDESLSDDSTNADAPDAQSVGDTAGLLRRIRELEEEVAALQAAAAASASGLVAAVGVEVDKHEQ